MFVSNHALGVDLHVYRGVHKVWCVDFNLQEKIACNVEHTCYTTVCTARKVAPSFRGCIIMRNQYFYGWKKKYPPPMYSWKKKKKKHFVHHSWRLTWDEKEDQIIEECSIFL